MKAWVAVLLVAAIALGAWGLAVAQARRELRRQDEDLLDTVPRNAPETAQPG